MKKYTTFKAWKEAKDDGEFKLTKSAYIRRFRGSKIHFEMETQEDVDQMNAFVIKEFKNQNLRYFETADKTVKSPELIKLENEFIEKIKKWGRLKITFTSGTTRSKSGTYFDSMKLLSTIAKKNIKSWEFTENDFMNDLLKN